MLRPRSTSGCWNSEAGDGVSLPMKGTASLPLVSDVSGCSCKQSDHCSSVTVSYTHLTLPTILLV
eukprot:6928291-Pyramimonas_sp.AAC.1